MPRFRGAAALSAGVGAALIAGGLFAPSALLFDARLPLDLQNTTWTMSDPGGVADGEPAPVTRQLHMDLRSPADEDTVSVRVGDSLRAGEADTDFDNLVTASTWSFSMNRRSGEVEQPAQLQSVMAMPAADVAIDGVWLKFPTDVKRQAYDVFDPTLRASVAAEFVGEEEMRGRKVYRFYQQVDPTNLAQQFADDRNTTYLLPEGDTPADGASEDGASEGDTSEGGAEELPGEQSEVPPAAPERAYLFHSAERELLVDQATGVVVGMNEQVDDYYGDAAGRGLRNVVKYDAAADANQVDALLEELDGVVPAGRVRTLSWAAIGVGAALVLLALLTALFGRRSRAVARPGRAEAAG